MTEKVTIAKLAGQSNYEVWALRIQSLLVEKGSSSAITTNSTISAEEDLKALATIRLVIEDGPLL